MYRGTTKDMNTSLLASCLNGTPGAIYALLVLIGCLCATIVVILIYMSYMHRSLMRLNSTFKIVSKTFDTPRQI